MENTGKIFGISLGPGDPELITLKALKALNAVDVIFCPGTKSGEGRMKSRALDILRQLEVDETKIRLFQVPMSRDRQEALCAYDRVCGEVLELVRSGLQLKGTPVFILLLIICTGSLRRPVFRLR